MDSGNRGLNSFVKNISPVTPGWNGPNFFSILNSLPNNNFLDWTKLKEFAGNKLNVAKVTISLFDWVENTVGKGENAGYQNFLHFPQFFPNLCSLRL